MVRHRCSGAKCVVELVLSCRTCRAHQHGTALTLRRATEASHLERDAATCGEDEDAVGNEERLTNVVGHEEDRCATHQLGQLFVEAGARQRIERSERLVEEYERRVANECARKCDALALATREIRWGTIGEVLRLHARECCDRSSMSGAPIRARNFEGE
jgi:hypothetical protein